MRIPPIPVISIELASKLHSLLWVLPCAGTGTIQPFAGVSQPKKSDLASEKTRVFRISCVLGATVPKSEADGQLEASDFGTPFHSS